MDARTHFATKALTSNDTFIALQIQDPFPCDLVALYISLLKNKRERAFFFGFTHWCVQEMLLVSKSLAVELNCLLFT